MLNLWRWERKKDGMVKSQHMRIQPVKIDWLFCAPCLVPACLRICFWWTSWCIVVGFWFSPREFNGVSFFTLNASIITCNSHFEAFEIIWAFAPSHPERIKQIRASTCRRQIEKRRWTCLLDSKLQNEEENQNSHRLNQETIALQQSHDKKTTRVGHGIQRQTLVISDVGCLSLKNSPSNFVCRGILVGRIHRAFPDSSRESPWVSLNTTGSQANQRYHYRYYPWRLRCMPFR